MFIYKVIIPMTELSDPPSYKQNEPAREKMNNLGFANRSVLSQKNAIYKLETLDV